MATIQGAHIFSAGEWNRQSFTENDLDKIVQAFHDAGKAGRVPLKYGHGDSEDAQPFREGLPALGWVSKLWRQGKKLMADFSDVPPAVFESIRKGLYRYTSIELLKNAKYEGQTFPFLLDAVALLGAEPPAVDGLEDLQKLTLARSSFKYSGRFCFTTAAPGNDSSTEMTTKLLPLTLSGVSEADLATIASTATPLPVWLGRAIAGHITKITRTGDSIKVAITIAHDVAAALNAGTYKAVTGVTGGTKGILLGATLDGLDMTPDAPTFARLTEQLRVVTVERDAAREEVLQFKRGDLKAIKDAEAERVVNMCLRFIKESFEKPLPPKQH